MSKDLNISVRDTLKVSDKVSIMNEKEVVKVLYRMLNENIPVPATLIVCCFIDALSQNYSGLPWERFAQFIKEKMPNTMKILEENDNMQKTQIDNLDCKIHPKYGRCKSSAEILYRHVRCGLVHDYFSSSGVAYINKIKGKDYSNYALVINAPIFVMDFIKSINK